ncbi:MAG TPA: DUF1800 family protein [Verrucomicrobiae bacterium]|nr:DUF1800 family protein [Verrucomicrobiae bacterium]
MKKPRHFLLPTLLALVALVTGLARAQVAGSITVYPTTSSLEFTSTQQFTAYVPISPNTITWSVNDVVGGNATVGTISATGLYQPPAVIPAANVLTVKARSVAYPNQVGAATLTLTRPYPWLWSVSPSKLQTGNFKVSFNGSNFAPDSVATANGVDLPTTYISPTSLSATGSAPNPGTLKFAIRQPANGAVTGNIVNVNVQTSVVTVAVSPTTASVPLSTSKSFSATVTGNANTAVTWSVNGVVGGSMMDGTISTSGVYAAPAMMPGSSNVTIRATSVANPAVFAQAAVTLTPPPPPVTVTVNPPSANVAVTKTQAFTATLVGSPNTSVTWSVNGVNGGASSTGTINSSGVYTAPASVPANPTVTIRATSVVNPSSYAQATVTITPPVTVSITPNGASVSFGNSQNFSATVNGNADQSVTWAVNNTVGGSATLGFITSAGVYTAPAAPPGSATVTVKATSVAVPSASATVTVTLTAQPPAQVSLTNARFLEQSSFGPNAATLAAVQQMGIPAYLDYQFNLPETPIPTPADNSVGTLAEWQLMNFTIAEDQLRQRVAYALSQIIVTSGNKLIYADAMLPWMRLLSQHAFGNYRNLLHDISICPSMGKYLDLANSTKPGPGGGANENYARELMQLFTIGLVQLNQDGSPKLDGNNQTIPTYTQATVAQVALALTGWVYAQPASGPVYEYFGAPMVSRQSNHDTTSKSILGVTFPAGQTVEQDLDMLIDTLMNHPNMAPFIATRLIRSLVMSNPSPGYIQRVADVFVNNGAGVRGDLKAVVTAILMDPEARNDSPTVNGGRLKEPILQISNFLRALNGHFNPDNGLVYLYDYMAQPPLNPPSVFGWYSPLYHVPKSPLFGPEFQIYSATEAVLRGNFFFSIINYPATDMTVDLSPFQPYGNDMAGLVEAANQTLLYGRMPAAMKQAIITAAAPGYDAKTRIETALYLTALSGQYAVQY